MSGYPLIYRFRPNNNNTIDELENSYVYFQNSKMLNDPFDCYSKLMFITDEKNELIKLFKIVQYHLTAEQKEKFRTEISVNIFENFRLFLESFLEDYILRFGIACFTMTPANYLMWSHYSNFHQGICVEYNVELDKDFFAGLMPVRYVENFETKEYRPLSNENDFTHIIRTKSDVWKNEYELRLVKGIEGKNTFKKECLTKIIFGLKTSENFKNTMIQSTNRKYPNLEYFEIEPLKNKFGIRMNQIII